MTGRAKRTAGGLSLLSRIISANFGLVLATVVVALSAAPAMATHDNKSQLPDVTQAVRALQKQATTAAKASATRCLGEADKLLQMMRQAPVASVSRSDAIRGLSSKAAAQFLTLANEVGGKLNNPASIAGRWQEFLAGMRVGDVPMDINALVAFVLREAYMEQNKDLKYYADKVRRANKKKEEILNKLRSARNQLEALDKGTGASTTRKNWESEIEALEDALVKAGDDARLANIELQNALQKQQQTLQTMSNVSKMLHDTAMAIIRKHG